LAEYLIRGKNLGSYEESLTHGEKNSSKIVAQYARIKAITGTFRQTKARRYTGTIKKLPHLPFRCPYTGLDQILLK
jgi:hypothetical protein